MRRHTLRAPIERAGVGVHQGRPCRVRLQPAPPGHGRTLNGGPLSAAAAADRPLATTIQSPTGPVSTVEHLLAALSVLEVDDVGITVAGGEVPILDGSAGPWRDAIIAAGRVPQPGPPLDPLTPLAPVEVREGDRWVRASPASALSFRVTIVYPALGSMTVEGPLAALDLDARTFGFYRDAERLWAAGLARGADRRNTLVFGDDGAPIAGCVPRRPDEPAHHKWLDLVGDLALLGRPLVARVEAHKAGHALHRRLVERLADRPPATTGRPAGS